MYAAPVWNPLLKSDIAAFERVQRRFTKKFAGFNNMSYGQRLSALNALTLEQERFEADVITPHRCINGKSEYYVIISAVAKCASSRANTLFAPRTVCSLTVR